MRASVLLLALLLPAMLLAQRGKSELISLSVTDVPLPVILDSVSEQTSYFFSYNSDIFPSGSRYAIRAQDEPVDQFLSRLLVGTGLKYSFYKDQIIIKVQPPEEQVVRRKNFFSITGKVLDERGEPITGVNIFLDGTSIGTFSDIDGNYTLESIPPGYFDLVFSHVGYQSGVYRVNETRGSARIQNHQLLVSSEELEEVSVVSDRVTSRQEDWVSYYQIFKDELLGRSPRARECVIENPEVINFSKRGEKLIAFASEAIVIRNDALGYRIDYFLETFEKNENDLRFRGKMRFLNQEPTNARERKTWKRSRKLSYLGSYNHFKQALLKDELNKEGFKIYTTKGLKKVPKKDRSKLLTANDILTFSGSEYLLSFDDNLVVEYVKEKESLDYLNGYDFVDQYYEDYINEQGILIKSPENQASIIRLLRTPVRLDPTGQIIDKFALTTYGYWSWERLGELVPINYDPKWDFL